MSAILRRVLVRMCVGICVSPCFICTISLFLVRRIRVGYESERVFCGPNFFTSVSAIALLGAVPLVGECLHFSKSGHGPLHPFLSILKVSVLLCDCLWRFVICSVSPSSFGPLFGSSFVSLFQFFSMCMT